MQSWNSTQIQIVKAQYYSSGSYSKRKKTNQTNGQNQLTTT